MGHFSGGDLQKFIFVFHMPFFFIIAGYLLNLSKWGGADNFKKFSAKLFKRLLMPYFIAEILFYPIWFVVCHEAGYLKYWGRWYELNPVDAFIAIFIGNGNNSNLILGVLWFLPALLFTEIIFIRLYNRLNKIGAEVFVLALVACSLLGLLIGRIHALPLGIDIALAAQIFILVGVLIRKYNFVERLTPRICGVLMFILVLMFYFNERIDMNFRIYGNPLMFYAGGIAGSLLVMKLSTLMTDGKIFSLISDCGRQSMMILVLHPIVANIAYEIIVGGFNFPAEKIFTEPAIIFPVTAAGVLIPLFIAKKFGKLPVLKIFCP
ncbi:MAG: acyltransferase family protein [Selenomonadaceae bacterium]|nr:acyltransferase family protein [Selenomonadaceae bacterium]